MYKGGQLVRIARKGVKQKVGIDDGKGYKGADIDRL